MEILIAKASPVGDQKIEDVTIKITAEPPNYESSVWAQFCNDQAETIAQALCRSLPGGTFDRLVAKLLLLKSSLLKVSYGSEQR